MTQTSAFAASVIITTKNRKEELRNAIVSCLRQTVPVEVVVFDDGSTDGTAEMVKQEFPQVRLHRVEKSLGIVEARNRAMRLASCQIAFTIDDDCVFQSERTVAQTLDDFDHPRVGAVAIPSIDIRQSPKVWNQAPDASALYVDATFRGGANAMRRDLFLCLDGYRGFLVQRAEESDYAIRMLNVGYVVRLGRADPIHHLESPTRRMNRIVRFGARSNVLFAWYNVPMPYLPAHLAVLTWNLLRNGARLGCFWSAVNGILRGYGATLRQLGQRRPVSRRAYRLMRLLRKNPIPLEAIEEQLPPLARCRQP
jgi:glycosyltransferase involved in cell wall biosynthesis